MKCGKCGKEMEIEGANRWYPPKKDDMGRDICPWCAHPNGPQRYGFVINTGPANPSMVADNPFAPPGKKVDWAKLVDDLNKAMRKPGTLVPTPAPDDHDVHMRASDAFFARMAWIDDIIFGDEPFVPDMSDPLGGAHDELDDAIVDACNQDEVICEVCGLLVDDDFNCGCCEYDEEEL